MKSLRKLTISKAIEFRVPSKIAENPDNIFFAETDFSDMDGPWKFMAFIPEDLSTGTIWFHICDVFPESLEWNEFNPIFGSGYFGLKINEFDQFISTISSVFSSFFTTDHQQLTELKPSFRLIETEELSNYGLVRDSATLFL